MQDVSALVYCTALSPCSVSGLIEAISSTHEQSDRCTADSEHGPVGLASILSEGNGRSEIWTQKRQDVTSSTRLPVRNSTSVLERPANRSKKRNMPLTERSG